MSKLTGLFEGALGMVFLAFGALVGLGYLYWLWMAIQWGNFWMFVVGFLPPFMVLAGSLGAWSLLFGVPEWVVEMFAR